MCLPHMTDSFMRPPFEKQTGAGASVRNVPTAPMGKAQRVSDELVARVRGQVTPVRVVGPLHRQSRTTVR